MVTISGVLLVMGCATVFSNPSNKADNGYVNVRYLFGTAFLARTCEVGTEKDCGGVYGVGYSANWPVKVGDVICTGVMGYVPGTSTDELYAFKVIKQPNSDTHISFWGTDDDPQYHTSPDIQYLGSTGFGPDFNAGEVLAMCKAES